MCASASGGTFKIPPIWAAAGAAIAAFCAASIDELLVLVAAFAKASLPNANVTTTDIILGALLGTSGVLALSALGLIGFFVPIEYVKLLGFVPFIMGIRQLTRRFLKWRRRRGKSGAGAEGAGVGAGERASAHLLDAPPPEHDAVSSAGAGGAGEEPPRGCRGCAALGVAAVVVAGGAEEVALYLPLLAAESGAPINVAVVILVLLGMTVVWLGVAAALVRSGAVAKAVESVGEAAEPWLFVALGVYCLAGSVALPFSF